MTMRHYSRQPPLTVVGLTVGFCRSQKPTVRKALIVATGSEPALRLLPQLAGGGDTAATAQLLPHRIHFLLHFRVHLDSIRPGAGEAFGEPFVGGVAVQTTIASPASTQRVGARPNFFAALKIQKAQVRPTRKNCSHRAARTARFEDKTI